MATTTFRADLRDALFAYMTAFKAANPTLVPGELYRTRPGSIVPPAMYIGALNEPRITTAAQVRQREMRPQVVIVHSLIDRNSAADIKDETVDTWIDYVNDNPHIAGGLIEASSTSDIDLEYGGAIYSATVVFHKAEIQEGRL
jgi:hypothetical protein